MKTIAEKVESRRGARKVPQAMFAMLLMILFASSGIAEEKPSKWEWNKLKRPTRIWDPKIDATAPKETRRVRIVDFGQANCRYSNKVGYGYSTIPKRSSYENLLIDTDGNPATDDWVQTIPFSLTKSIMSPRVPQWDTSWDSSTFRGGIGFIYSNRRDKNGLTECYTNTAEGDELMKPGSDFAIHAQHKVKNSNIRCYFVPVWTKKEFPHLGNKYPVSFDETSKIGLYTQRYWSGYDGVRFVVKDSGQLYLSEVLPNNWRKFDGKWDLRILFPVKGKWSKWSVKEGDWDLKLQDEKLETRTFSNVEAIGFYIFKDKFDEVEVASKWECFEAYANVTQPKILSEMIDMRETQKGTYMATCETPYEVWKTIFRMSRSIGQFVFDDEPGMLYDRFGNMGSMRQGKGKYTQAEPVTDLTLRDVLAWCNAISEYEGREMVYYTTPDFQKGSEFRYVIRGPMHKEKSIHDKKPIYVKWAADGYRLPTPAEWLAGYNKADEGWVGESSEGRTHAVGTKAANAKGLYDMKGNVHELLWTYGDVLPVDFKTVTAAGGDFNYPANPMDASASPFGDSPFTGGYNIGFRLLRREKGAAKPNVEFDKDSFGAPVWVITPETKTKTHAEVKVDIPLADIPEGKVFGYTMTAFKMGTHEITYAQWKYVFDWAKEHGYTFDSDGDMGSMDHRLYTVAEYSPDEPVTDISYFDMLAWCNALSEIKGVTPVFYSDKERTKIYRTSYRYRQSQQMNRNYSTNGKDNGIKAKTCGWNAIPTRRVYIKWEADGYRLPSVNEWNYCYGGNAKTKYPWGEKLSDFKTAGWSYENADARTHPVGQKEPNGFGLYDMFGNVIELCVDSAGKSNGFVRGQTTNALYRFNSYEFSSKTRATYRKVGIVDFEERIFTTSTKKVDATKFAGVVAGWYWPDCGFRIVKRNAGDYLPTGIDLSKKPTKFTPLNLDRKAGDEK